MQHKMRGLVFRLGLLATDEHESYRIRWMENRVSALSLNGRRKGMIKN